MEDKFQLFIVKYLENLSGYSNLTKEQLLHQAELNVRIWPPLIVWAIQNQCAAEIYSKIKNSYMREILKNISEMDENELINNLQSAKINIPYEVEKIWNSFLSDSKRDVYEAQFVAIAREKILEKNISKDDLFKLCSFLNLDFGSVQNWINGKETDYITRAIAYSIWKTADQIKSRE